MTEKQSTVLFFLIIIGIWILAGFGYYRAVQYDRKVELCEERASSYFSGKKSEIEDRETLKDLDYELDKRLEECKKI